MPKAKGPQDLWDKMSRNSKLARVMYPNLVEPEIHKLMQGRLANEGKAFPTGGGLLSDATRGHVSPLGGTMTPAKPAKGKRR